MSNKYDIFISYRRVGGAQYARILQLMLSQRGYRVFLDYDELRDGVFGKKIKAAIQEAPWHKIGRAVQQECRDRSRMPSSA